MVADGAGARSLRSIRNGYSGIEAALLVTNGNSSVVWQGLTSMTV